MGRTSAGLSGTGRRTDRASPSGARAVRVSNSRPAQGRWPGRVVRGTAAAAADRPKLAESRRTAREGIRMPSRTRSCPRGIEAAFPPARRVLDGEPIHRL
ncbi:hypothetical protein GCM10009759_58150 [Kitasatospora saccharophila]|uniref:Uncharacterized protein n=1 Tax=Kitasatospora saccharophila TaxID=407973 RepID=A0ABP5J9P7_9ACTN